MENVSEGFCQNCMYISCTFQKKNIPIEFAIAVIEFFEISIINFLGDKISGFTYKIKTETNDYHWFSWIFMNPIKLRQVLAPSSVNRFERPDMFFIRTRRDLAIARDVIR